MNEIGRSDPDVMAESPLISIATHEDALARLRRVHGQLGGVIHMLEANRTTTDVLTQLAAITHALHRAGYRMVADEMARCHDQPPGSGQLSAEQLERLFLALG